MCQPFAYSRKIKSKKKAFKSSVSWRWVDHAIDDSFSLSDQGLLMFLPLLPIIFIWMPTPSGEQSPQIQVEILATGVVVLQFLQLVINHKRAQEKHWSYQWTAWAAYYMPVPLATYALGVMLRFRCPYWLVATFFAAGMTDTMGAYSLHDKDEKKVRNFAKWALSLAYLGIALLNDGVPYKSPLVMMFLLLGFIILLLGWKISSWAMIPTSDLCMAAAQHGRFQSTALEPEGTAFVVAVGPLNSYQSAVSGITTLEDIVDINCSPRMVDICLSSALFFQLLRRCFTPQDGDCCSSLNIYFRDQVGKNKDGLETAFQLVQVQLSFMYDYFFSAHGSPSRKSPWLHIGYSLLNIALLICVLSLFYWGDQHINEPQLITSVYAIYGLILLQLCQLRSHVRSNLLLVSYMCQRAAAFRQSCATSRRQHRDEPPVVHENLFEAMLGRQKYRWQNALGQYSLLDDFDSTSLNPKLMGHLIGRHEAGTLATPVALSDDVKEWIFNIALHPDYHGVFVFPLSLKSRRGLLGQLSKQFITRETEIQTILIWHIATWFCARSEHAKSQTEVLATTEYKVATELSSYCAYLVAFCPELLPGHHTMTTSIFLEAVEEAEKIFKGETSRNDRYTKLAKWDPKDLPDDNIFKLGIKLARQLIGSTKGKGKAVPSRRWETMANFWAEMLLLVALSSTATAHLEHLAKGGEFITLLWAFLSNAGIRPYQLKEPGSIICKSNPPDLSIQLIKKLGAEFCQIDEKQLTEKALNHNKKTAKIVSNKGSSMTEGIVEGSEKQEKTNKKNNKKVMKENKKPDDDVP